MSWEFSKEDIRTVGDNMYQIGPVEFEIIPGQDKIGYKNVETELSGAASIDELRKDFGDDVASFFQAKLGH